MNLFIELNNLVLKYRFYPKKGSGIHFVKKESLLEEILRLSNLKKSDKVLEVNAGEFFIAREISKKASLTAFEQRTELIPLLKKELPKINLINASFVSYSKKLNVNKCVSFFSSGNLSDNFSKLFYFDFDLMVLLLPKEFAEKILAEPGFVDYGFAGVLTDSFFEVIEVVEVQSDYFFPPTSGEFCLIKLKKNKVKLKNKKEFFEFVKILFRFKNRVFVSALTKALPLMKLDEKTKSKIKKKLNEIEFNQKVYLMESSEFIELFSELIK